MAEQAIYEIDIQGLEQEIKQVGQLANALGQLDKQFELLRLDQKEVRQEFEKGIKTEKEFDKVNGQLIKRTAELRQKRLQLNQATRNVIKAEQAQTGSLNQLRAQYNLLIQQLGNISLATDKGRKEFARQSQEANKLSARIKELERSYGSNVRNVGNYQSALSGLSNRLGSVITQIAGSAGLVVGFAALGQAIRSAANTVIDFEAGTKRLQAITGATDKELAQLTRTAKELGSTTQFTASEVVGLQTELAKLGFTTEQVIAAQEAILNLSIVAGASLPESAELAGSTVRAFGLEASDTAEVVDVLSKAFTSSALDFSKFEAAITQVAPVARTFGFTIQETTALLGQLTNAGFRGEQAGTALRNIFLNLADVNGKLAQRLGGNVKSFDELIPALIQLRDSGADLNETLELTDKRSVAAFNQFLQGAESADRLRDSLNEAQGSAQLAADTIADSTAGAIKVLRSEIEGYLLNEGEGLNNALRGSIDFLRNTLFQLNDLGTAFSFLQSQISPFIDALDSQELTEFGLNLPTIRDELSKFNDIPLEELEKDIEGVRKEFVAFVQASDAFSVNAEEASILFDRFLTKRTREYLATLTPTVQTQDEFNQSLNEENKILAALFPNLSKTVTETEKLASTLSFSSLEKQIKELRDAQSDLDLSTQSGIQAYRQYDQQISVVEATVRRLKEQIEGVTGTVNLNTEGITEIATDIQEQIGQVNVGVDLNASGQTDSRSLLERLLVPTEQEKEQLKQQGIASAIDIVGSVSNAISSLRQQQLEEETNARIAALEKQKEAGIISEKEFENSVERINKQAAQQQKRIQRIQAIINTALAVTNALATSPFPFNLIQAATVAAAGAAEIAVINRQKFKEGGQIPFSTGGFINGPSHNQGGVKFAMGGRIAEAEGGEIVLTKGVGRNPRLRRAASNLNAMGGGKRFQTGGVIEPLDTFAFNSTLDSASLNSSLDNRFRNLRVINVVTDTTDQQQAISNIQANSDF